MTDRLARYARIHGGDLDAVRAEVERDARLVLLRYAPSYITRRAAPLETMAEHAVDGHIAALLAAGIIDKRARRTARWRGHLIYLDPTTRAWYYDTPDGRRYLGPDD